MGRSDEKFGQSSCLGPFYNIVDWGPARSYKPNLTAARGTARDPRHLRIYPDRKKVRQFLANFPPISLLLLCLGQELAIFTISSLIKRRPGLVVALHAHTPLLLRLYRNLIRIGYV